MAAKSKAKIGAWSGDLGVEGEHGRSRIDDGGGQRGGNATNVEVFNGSPIGQTAAWHRLLRKYWRSG